MCRWSPPARRPAPHRQHGSMAPRATRREPRFHHWAVVGTAGEEKAGLLPWTSLQVDGQTQRDDLPARGEATRMQSPVSSGLHSQRPPSQGHVCGGQLPRGRPEARRIRELAPTLPAQRRPAAGARRALLPAAGEWPSELQGGVLLRRHEAECDTELPGATSPLGLPWSASGGIRHAVSTTVLHGYHVPGTVGAKEQSRRIH